MAMTKEQYISAIDAIVKTMYEDENLPKEISVLMIYSEGIGIGKYCTGDSSLISDALLEMMEDNDSVAEMIEKTMFVYARRKGRVLVKDNKEEKEEDEM